MANKQGNRLQINMISYAVLQIVNMLVGLFLPRLYLAVYGSEVNGVISTINSFISYFSYLEAGLGLTLIHSLFKPLATGDEAELNGILSFSKKRYQKISYIYFCLVVCLSLIFPFLQVAQGLGRIEFMALVFVIGLYGALDFYTMAKYRVLLTADRKEYVISNAMIVAQLLRFVFVWLLLRLDLSVVWVKLVPIFTLAVRSIILKVYVSKKYPQVNFSVSPSTDITLGKERFDALLLQISISTSISLPTIIISQILGFKEANVFAVYSLVANAVISIVSALSSGVSPMLGRNIAQGKDVKETYTTYEGVVAFVIALTFSVTAIMILPFINLYTNVVSDVNYLRPSYAILISLWAALYSYRIPATAIINAAGIYRENRINNILNLVFQVVLGVLGAIFFGVVGVLVVMCIASIGRNVFFAKVNSKVLLHNGVVRTIVWQLVIIATILGSYYLSTLWIVVENITIFKWILLAFGAVAVEFIICLGLFAVVDFKTFRKLLRSVKKKIRHQ